MPVPPVNEALEELDRCVEALGDDIRDVRRYLHAHPEASGQEFRTTAWLAERLRDRDIPHRVAPTGRGLIVDFGDDASEGCIALRADIDALRLQDEKTVVYHSREANRMHACGHDAHTAMALGATFALHRWLQHVDAPPAMRIIFQPSEETATGAREMIKAGAMDGVRAILALHVDPQLPAGTVGFRYGPLTAICEEFDVEITGRGGHGARPHQTIDPIGAAALFINSVYNNVPRSLDAREPAVVSFGVFQAGINPNVIPERAQLRGTIRTVHTATAEAIRAKMRAIGDGVAAATGASVSFDFPYTLRSVDNDPEVTDVCREAARAVVGKGRVQWIEHPSMGGEDFANYLDLAPGCMLRLGVGFPDQAPRFLHSPQFDLDETALVPGARILARGAMLLAQRRSRSSSPASA